MLTYKQWLEEATLKDLATGTTNFRHSPSEYPQAKFVNIDKIVPSLGVKTLTFFGNIPSFTRREAAYNQTILFKNVKFADTKIDENYVQIPDNEDIWYEKPKLEGNDVSCRCGCSDDRFRWQVARKAQKALFGNLISYTKKTDRPPLNPDNIAGVCKHISNFVKALTIKNYISE
jgi:hypothetical protein